MNPSALLVVLLVGLLLCTAPVRVEAGGLLGVEDDSRKTRTPPGKVESPEKVRPDRSSSAGSQGAIELPPSVKESPVDMVKRVAAELAHEEHIRDLREGLQVDAAMTEVEGRTPRTAPRAPTARGPRGTDRRR